MRVAGIVVARARPPTKSGCSAIFVCLEDETGLVDATIFEDTYQQYGWAIVTSPVLLIEGKLSRLGKPDLSVIAERVEPLGRWEEAGKLEKGKKVFPSKDWGR